MAKTVSDLFVEGIIKWGVKVVFGIPGDGINGVIEALRKRQDEIRFIQVRHEESAAFMACAYAKYTGKLGCCLATSGPGAIHLLNGLYDAKLDGAPVPSEADEPADSPFRALASVGQPVICAISGAFGGPALGIALASDVRRIHDPYRPNPERILEQKDAIAHELRRIADDLEKRYG